MKLLLSLCLQFEIWGDIYNFKFTFNSSISFPTYPLSFSCVFMAGTVRNSVQQSLIVYSQLPPYNHQASICRGIVMVTPQGEFTDWLGRHKERDINDRKRQYMVSGQRVVPKSTMPFWRAELIRQSVPEGAKLESNFNRCLELERRYQR